MLKRVINKLLSFFEIKTISDTGKTVFLTFDDGPQPGITEFVLGELDKYGFKGTFFCRGDNADSNPELLKMLRDKGHSVGNHTYSHLHSFEVDTKKYIDDVRRADVILRTSYFRPPHGSLTLGTWMRLHAKYRIFFWKLNSGDSDLEKYDYTHSIESLKNKTKAGDIVLFHFCHRHEKETRQLLPAYLKWLFDQGFECKAI